MNIRDLLEIMYYVSFILLTILLVVYAIRTYKFQSKRYSELYFKLYIPESEMLKSFYAIFLETYNHGNISVRNININIDNKKSFAIDFLKPGESYSFIIGEAFIVYKEKDTDTGVNAIILGEEINQNMPISITYIINGRETRTQINTSVIFAKSYYREDKLDGIAKNINRMASFLEYALKPDGLNAINGSIGAKLSEIRRSIDNLITRIK